LKLTVYLLILLIVVINFSYFLIAFEHYEKEVEGLRKLAEKKQEKEKTNYNQY
jgi:putative NIF3 family GTP cyclohydrolase 1 type 2